ncbi:MAG: thiamine-phosphate kinase [Endomicrobium sp.]|jgi:thiamine-monophosphate kinase|nr:thiamine-phosphate kinase [Endomicrobium sp.]
MKTLKNIGEFGFIETIKKDFASAADDKNITVGIGDDCFCFRNGAKSLTSRELCVTKDLLCEDVHFKKEWTTPADLGRKTVEVNVSDIASMGAVRPKYVFIGFGAPPDTPLNYIKQFYTGVKDACKKYGAQIAGGDTVKSDKIIISATIIGESFGKIIKRSGAKDGDLIGITNTFGGAGAGVALLYKYGIKRKYSKDELYLIAKQNKPQARLKEAFEISKFASSMTDASDGLFISIALLSKGARVDLEKISVSKQLKNVFPDVKKQTEFALFGAEDYELVFTAPQNSAQKLKKLLPQISYIGKITNSNKVRYFYNGKEQKTVYAGFKHF